MKNIRLKLNSFFVRLYDRLTAHFAGVKWYFYLVDGLLLAMIIAAAIFFHAELFAPDPRLNITLDALGTKRSYLAIGGEDGDVGSFLAKRGLSVGKDDSLSHKLDSPMADGMNITLTGAFPVAVRSAGQVKLINVAGGTVGDALRECGISFDTADEISHLSFEDLVPGMKIIHTDVVTEYTSARRTIAYKETVIYDEDVYNDTKPVLMQAGSNGSKQVTQRVVIKDGVEVSREVVNQIIITPAVDEIVKQGSKIHYQTHLEGEFRIYKKAPTAGRDGWIEMRMDYITAYCTGRITSTGSRPKLGTIAVSPKYIPYGTEIYVPGYGYGVAKDTGAFRNYINPDGSYVNQLDLWMNTEKECNRWGRKRNVVVLVKMG